MKRYIYAAFLVLFVLPQNLSAQTVTYLSTNFDVACATSTGIPSDWMRYTPVSGTNPFGAWHCDPTLGRKNAASAPTPGMLCTNYWSVASHLDTSYFISPLLDLSSYTTAYLYFDTRTDIFTPNGKVAVLISYDTGASVATYFYVDSTTALNPNFSIQDTGWKTHELDLITHCHLGAQPFHIAFRYTGNTTMGTAWYLDNVNIRPSRLNVTSMNKDSRPLTVIGNSTSSQIKLSFYSEISGSYDLRIYDMVGKNVHSEKMDLVNSANTYTINGLHLNPGMYFIKMTDGMQFFSTKAIVQ